MFPQPSQRRTPRFRPLSILGCLGHQHGGARNSAWHCQGAATGYRAWARRSLCKRNYYQPCIGLAEVCWSALQSPFESWRNRFASAQACQEGAATRPRTVGRRRWEDNIWRRNLPSQSWEENRGLRRGRPLFEVWIAVQVAAKLRRVVP